MYLKGLLVLVLLGLFVSPALAQAPKVDIPNEETLLITGGNTLIARNYISLKDRYEGTLIYCLAMCESSFNPNAWNKKDPNDGSKGLLQFQDITFYRYAPLAGVENPDIWNVEHQIKTAEYMISLGLRYHWSCSKLCW